ncbi:hypothetical protein A2U01_0034736 [Trifolium medium]|uniref:Uncharacterized protein n=1 Tax=Trifolium medium TaxID=97028 RepID=A0A392PPP6_9FABA|nr:hypothetical protein [Trifolium medium]
MISSSESLPSCAYSDAESYFRGPQVCPAEGTAENIAMGAGTCTPGLQPLILDHMVVVANLSSRLCL